MKFAEASHPAVLDGIRQKRNIDDELKQTMREAVEDFKSARWETAAAAVV